jgi:hypothetical protein
VLLVLSTKTGKSSQQRYRDRQQFLHAARLPKLRCVCKAKLERGTAGS